MSRNVEQRYDSVGKLIKAYDVLKNEETGEMALVTYSENKAGVKGLGITNELIGSSDWLDVFPNGTWTIVGNAKDY